MTIDTGATLDHNENPPTTTGRKHTPDVVHTLLRASRITRNIVLIVSGTIGVAALGHTADNMSQAISALAIIATFVGVFTVVTTWPLPRTLPSPIAALTWWSLASGNFIALWSFSLYSVLSGTICALALAEAFLARYQIHRSPITQCGPSDAQAPQ